jgi:2-methylcitrate dehydratase PrpD
MTYSNITNQIAHYINKTNYETLPEDILEKAKLCLLDWIAVTLAGSKEEISDITFNLIHMFNDKEQATILGRRSMTNPLSASLINGVNAHVLDFDEGILEGPGHPSAPIIPAILALSEWKQLSGRDFILSFNVGVQVFFAFDTICMPNHSERGWHSTGTFGHLAATAGSAKLLGLNVSQIIKALGISATQVAGLKNTFGTMCKSLNTGKAAMNGLLAALLAEKNFTTSTDGIGGKGGFLEVYCAQSTPVAFESTLKCDFFLNKVKFKRYPSCFNTHAAIESILSLRRRYKIKPEQVSEIHCTVYPRCLEVSAIERPETGLEAKFSVQYCIAVALQEGRVLLNSFDDEKVKMPLIKNIMKKIKLRTEESYSKTRTSEVILKLEDGQKLKEKISLAEIFSDRKKEKEQVVNKFNEIASSFMAVERANQIIKTINSLEEIDSMSIITRLCQV